MEIIIVTMEIVIVTMENNHLTPSFSKIWGEMET